MPPGPPGGPPPYGPPPGGQPPKQGMSTGAKVGLGIGGCLVLVAIVIVVILVIASMSGGEESGPTSPPTTSEQEGSEGNGGAAPEDDSAAEEQGVSMTATAAGTAGDTIDDTVYTVVDVEITNNGAESLDINPLYFTAVLDDGTETSDWGETVFADIDQFDVETLAPGGSTSGQVAVVGEVVITELHYDPSFGMEEPVVTTVQ